MRSFSSKKQAKTGLACSAKDKSTEILNRNSFLQKPADRRQKEIHSEHSEKTSSPTKRLNDPRSLTESSKSPVQEKQRYSEALQATQKELQAIRTSLMGQHIKYEKLVKDQRLKINEIEAENLKLAKELSAAKGSLKKELDVLQDKDHKIILEYQKRLRESEEQYKFYIQEHLRFKQNQEREIQNLKTMVKESENKLEAYKRGAGFIQNKARKEVDDLACKEDLVKKLQDSLKEKNRNISELKTLNDQYLKSLQEKEMKLVFTEKALNKEKNLYKVLLDRFASFDKTPDSKPRGRTAEKTKSKNCQDRKQEFQGSPERYLKNTRSSLTRPEADQGLLRLKHQVVDLELKVTGLVSENLQIKRDNSLYFDRCRSLEKNIKEYRSATSRNDSENALYTPEKSEGKSKVKNKLIQALRERAGLVQNEKVEKLMKGRKDLDEKIEDLLSEDDILKDNERFKEIINESQELFRGFNQAALEIQNLKKSLKMSPNKPDLKHTFLDLAEINTEVLKLIEKVDRSSVLQNIIDSMTSQTHQLNQEIEDLSLQLENKNKEILNMRTSIQALQVEYSGQLNRDEEASFLKESPILNEDSCSLSTKINENAFLKFEEFDEMNKKIGDLIKEINEKEDNIKGLKKEAEGYKEQLLDSNEKMIKLKRLLSDSSLISEDESKIISKEEEPVEGLEVKQNGVSDAGPDPSGKEKVIKDLQDTIKSLSETLKNREIKLKLLESQKKQSQAESKETEDILKDLRSENYSLSQELESAYEKLREINIFKAELEEHGQAIEIKISSHEAQNKELSEFKNRLECENERLAEEVRTLKLKINEPERPEKTQAEAVLKEDPLRNLKIMQIEAEKKKLQTEILDLEDALKLLRIENYDLHRKIEAGHHEETEELSRENLKLLENNQDLSRKIQDLESRCQELASQKNHSNPDLEKTVKDLQEKTQELKEDLEAKSITIKNLEIALKTQAENQGKLVSQSSSTSEELLIKEKQVKDLSQKLFEVEKKQKALNFQINIIKTQKRKLEEDLKDRDMDLKELRYENINLIQKLDSMADKSSASDSD